jgi:hypothetical protein
MAASSLNKPRLSHLIGRDAVAQERLELVEKVARDVVQDLGRVARVGRGPYRLLLDGLVQAGAAAGASSSDDLNVDDGRLIVEHAAWSDSTSPFRSRMS